MVTSTRPLVTCPVSGGRRTETEEIALVIQDGSFMMPEERCIAIRFPEGHMPSITTAEHGSSAGEMKSPRKILRSESNQIV